MQPAADLVARLRWLADQDRCALVALLRTVDPHALDLAYRLAVRAVGPERPRPAEQLGQDEDRADV